MTTRDFSSLEFKSLSDIRKLLEGEGGGVATLKMWQLRDAFGAVKLGSNNVGEISRELAREGIGHIPVVMIPDQWEDVRVYLRSGSSGKLLDAAIEPGVAGDQFIREFSADQNATIIDQIRRLLN